MSQVDDFLATVMPRFTEAETALHNGDPEPRMKMWSQQDPVTVFGAAMSVAGWAAVAPVFERLGSAFSNCTEYRNELVAAGASGDLAYVVAIEHTTASMHGAPPAPYRLRVTTVFRREDGEWKVAHRHADTLGSETADTLKDRLFPATNG